MTNDDIVTRLRRIGTISDCEVAADEIEQLRAERDEARRELCRWSSFYYEEHSDVTAGRPLKRDLEEAERRGWDCFDRTPNDIEAHEIRGDLAGGT